MVVHHLLLPLAVLPAAAPLGGSPMDILVGICRRLGVSQPGSRVPSSVFVSCVTCVRSCVSARRYPGVLGLAAVSFPPLLLLLLLLLLLRHPPVPSRPVLFELSDSEIRQTHLSQIGNMISRCEPHVPSLRRCRLMFRSCGSILLPALVAPACSECRRFVILAPSSELLPGTCEIHRAL